MELISSNIKKLIFTLVFAAGCFTPLLANASVSAADVFGGAKQEACAGVELGTGPGGGGANCDEKNSSAVVSRTIKSIIDLLSVIVGIICVIVIIIGGFRYVTAAGDSNNLTSARNTIIYALVGLVIVAFAQLIVKLILTRIN